MKRVVIVCLLLAGMLWASVYSLHKVTYVHSRVLEHTDLILEAVSLEEKDLLISRAADLCAFWEQEEHSIQHFVRHSHIDEITKSMARLIPLAHYEDYPELVAELASVRWQIENLRHSELPVWDNIF